MIVVADEVTIYNVYNCNVLYKIERFIKEKATSKRKKKKKTKFLFEIPAGRIRSDVFFQTNNGDQTPNLHISLSHMPLSSVIGADDLTKTLFQRCIVTKSSVLIKPCETIKKKHESKKHTF